MSCKTSEIGDAYVFDIVSKDKKLVIGQEFRVEVNFSVPEIISGVPKETDLAIRFPQELSLVEDSARIYDAFDHTDNVTLDALFECADSSHIALFKLSRKELSKGSIIGDGTSSERMRVQVHAIAAGENLKIEAAADSNSSITSCEDFESEQDEIVSVGR